MVGRQLKVNGYVFTISSYTSATSIAIDQSWVGATASAQTYSIIQAYITPTPTDFHSFHSVLDVGNNYKLHIGIDALKLDQIDPKRSSSGTPYILAGTGTRNSSNIPIFELWPHPTTQRVYQYLYERAVPDLAEADEPPAIIRSDILVMGALADLARWPGTPERRNPMYDPYFNQWKVREADYKEALEGAIVDDQSIYQNDFTRMDAGRYFPLDANFMQSHVIP
jgi:hypothetical protein